jgi:hypothetical protein
VNIQSFCSLVKGTPPAARIIRNWRIRTVDSHRFSGALLLKIGLQEKSQPVYATVCS